MFVFSYSGDNSKNECGNETENVRYTNQKGPRNLAEFAEVDNVGHMDDVYDYANEIAHNGEEQDGATSRGEVRGQIIGAI